MPNKRRRTIDSITTRYHGAIDDRTRGQLRKEARAAGIMLPSHPHDGRRPTKPEVEVTTPDDPFKLLAAIAINEHQTPIRVSRLSRSRWNDEARPFRNTKEMMAASRAPDRLRAAMSEVAISRAQVSEQALNGDWKQWAQRPNGSTLTPVINKFFESTEPISDEFESIPISLTPTDSEPLIRVAEGIFTSHYDGVEATHQTSPTKRWKLAHSLSLSVVRYDYFRTQDLGDLQDEETMNLFEEMYLEPALEGDAAARSAIRPVASTLVVTKALSPGSQV